MRAICSPVLLVLAGAALLHAESAAGQACTTSSQGGYEVTRCETTAQPPRDSVGWKKTDRETRIGNTPETDGNSRTFVVVVGTFARKCPTAEGKVAGTFEFETTMDEVNTDEGETRRTHRRNRLMARLEGQVGDDANLQYVEIEGEITRERDGVPTERIPVPRQRFTPGPTGEPDWEAMRRSVEATGDLSVATAIGYSGPTFKSAQFEWSKPKLCVELTFDPPTDSVSPGPNESVNVRADIRTTGEQKELVQRWGRFNAEVKGSGSVAPRGSETPSDSPHSIRYTASAQPRKGHGFEIAALSRAGFAQGEWRIVDPGFEGTFKQTEVQPQRGTAGYGSAEILQKTTIEGRLVWSPERDRLQGDDLPHLPSFEGVRSTFYVPTDGEISVHFEYDATIPGSSCRFSGSKVIPITQLSPRALGYMSLEVADDGRYKLSLGMVAGTLPIRIVNEGCRWLIFPIDVDSVWNDAAIVIGHRQGTLTNDRIEGEVSPPIVSGPSTTTGSWSFVRGPHQSPGT